MHCSARENTIWGVRYAVTGWGRARHIDGESRARQAQFCLRVLSNLLLRHRTTCSATGARLSGWPVRQELAPRSVSGVARSQDLIRSLVDAVNIYSGWYWRAVLRSGEQLSSNLEARQARLAVTLVKILQQHLPVRPVSHQEGLQANYSDAGLEPVQIWFQSRLQALFDSGFRGAPLQSIVRELNVRGIHVTLWAPIPGLPSYRVSTDGHIENVRRPGRPRKQSGSSIYWVKIKQVSVYIHNAVGTAFLSPTRSPRDLYTHVDGCGGVNHITNLRPVAEGEMPLYAWQCAADSRVVQLSSDKQEVQVTRTEFESLEAAAEHERVAVSKFKWYMQRGRPLKGNLYVYHAAIDDFEMEEWRQIKRSPTYEVSNFARIRLGKSRQIVRSVEVDKSGYCRIRLFGFQGKKRRLKEVGVHRLVAEAFLERPRGLGKTAQVHHIDSNKLNNAVSNLRWVAAQENIALYTVTPRRVEQTAVWQCSAESGEKQCLYRTTATAARMAGVKASFIREQLKLAAMQQDGVGANGLLPLQWTKATGEDVARYLQVDQYTCIDYSNFV